MTYAGEFGTCDHCIEIRLTQEKIAWQVITLPDTNRKS
jgi:hypothetical protein